MNAKHFLLLVAGFCIVGFLRAQSPHMAPNGQIRCFTTQNEAIRRAEDPTIQDPHEFEHWMANKLAEQALQPSSQKTSATRVIPTVVHVIFSNAAENISDAQVQSQIDILNEDFQRLNADTTNTPAAFQAAAVDSDLEFCLASIDPNGNPTNGINRVSQAGSPFARAFVDNTIKPATIWNPDNYMNVWVVNLSGGLLGWAQFPSASGLGGMPANGGAANTDGVVMLTSSFGRPPFNTAPGPYNLGRTATHEVGHWLGLRHIWGDGGCGVDDFCADTPESDASNFGCVPAHNSCGTVDMPQNYMDYSDDACMNLFTADQKARMDVVMTNSPRRASLLLSNVCALVPEISYVSAAVTMTENGSSGTTGCRGYQDIDVPLRIGGPPVGAATVTMTVVGGTATQGQDFDIITGVVVFPDGVTGNQNFRIRVYDDSEVEVPETVTFGFTVTGTTDAYAGTPNQHVLTINDNDLLPSQAGTVTVFAEDFESGVNGWSTNNDNGGNLWAIAGANGAMSGAGSAYISRNGGGNNNYNVNQTSTSNLRTPLIDATGSSGLTLNFDHRVGGEANFDFGRLFYSLDGITYTQIPGSGVFQGVAGITNVSVPLPADCDNTTFYLSWFWVNDNSAGVQPAWAIDEVVVSGSGPVAVETDLLSTNTEYLGPNSTVYWYDQATGDVMLRVVNPTAHDYGCTSVTIDRQGTGASLYMSPSMNFALTDKTFRVNPANNNTAGAYDIRLYYTAAEIAGWEAATSESRANMTIAKTGGPISNITPGTPFANGATNYYGTTPGVGTFQTTDFWVEAGFNTGFSGFAAGLETTVLPVEFVHLDAEWSGADAALTWEVGEMSNVQIFEVERQLNDGSFVPVGRALPHPDGYGSNVYELKDAGAANLAASQLYYRVRAIDFDGSSTLSEVRLLTPGESLQATALPNPFDASLTLRLQLQSDENVSVRITNLLGQQVGTYRFDAHRGVNQLSLPVETLRAGVYLLDVQAGGASRRLKVVKS